jgi:hypothetical protein
MIVPEKSPSWKLRARGAGTLSDRTAGDWSGNSDSDHSMHTTLIQIPPMLAARVRKHAVGVELTLIGESVTTGSIWHPSKPKRLLRTRMRLEGLWTGPS